MKSVLTFCFLLLITSILAQVKPRQSFDGLKKLKLTNTDVEFWYNPAITTIYYLAFGNIDSTLLAETSFTADDE